MDSEDVFGIISKSHDPQGLARDMLSDFVVSHAHQMASEFKEIRDSGETYRPRVHMLDGDSVTIVVKLRSPNFEGDALSCLTEALTPVLWTKTDKVIYAYDAEVSDDMGKMTEAMVIVFASDSGLGGQVRPYEMTDSGLQWKNDDADISPEVASQEVDPVIALTILGFVTTERHGHGMKDLDRITDLMAYGGHDLEIDRTLALNKG